MFQKLKERFVRLWNNKAKLIGFIISTLIIVALLIYAPIQGWLTSGIEMRGITSIRGTSMEPTIKDNDILYVQEVKFERGEIVMTSLPDGDGSISLLKRIVGLPGETIEITKDGVVINGQLLPEEYTDATQTLQENNIYEEIILSDNEYFLLGDNRSLSYDSRHIGAFNARNFLYGLTQEPNEYTAWLTVAWTMIVIMNVLLIIILPTVLFLCLTMAPKPNDNKKHNGYEKTKLQSKHKASQSKNKNKKKKKKKYYKK